MNTPTHALINWTVAKFFGDGVISGECRFDRFGRTRHSVVLLDDRRGTLVSICTRLGSSRDPWWISLYNLLHSPLVLIVALIALYFGLGYAAFIKSWRVWFLGSCFLHTPLDVPLHHDDGPLLFWLLN